ncbi:MAG: ABC transporter substrate-binding protein [Chloroflexota bacterium]
MTQSQIKIGVLTILVGPFTDMGKDGLRGVKQAVAEFGGAIGDKPIILTVESTNAVPDAASDAAQTLIEQQHVDFIVGPLSGNEGIAVREYAKTQPHKVFLNGNAGAQDITLRNSAPNFFSFSTNGVQWMAGLGTYAYQTLGYRRVVTLAENYSYPHGQVGGFMIEFCRAGGRVAKKFWVALGTSDFSEIIAALPKDIDAIFTALAGGDAVKFLAQYAQAGKTAPVLAGTSTADQTILNVKGKLSEQVIGVVSAGPTADDNPAPAWQNFVTAYRNSSSDALPFPSLVAYNYYVNTKAALLALRDADCDLSNDQVRFKQALTNLEFESPTGPIKLDHNRQAIGNIFITVVDKQDDGTLYTRLIKTVPNVNQTLGIPEDEYLQLGKLTADNPTCP